MWQRGKKVSITLLVYIGDCKQDLPVISSDQEECVRCSVLGLYSIHRRVDHSSSHSARLA